MVAAIYERSGADSCTGAKPLRGRALGAILLQLSALAFRFRSARTPQWQPLLDLLMDVNQIWAAKAGALVALVARTHFEANDAPAATHSFDTGSAWMSMALQAQHMGLAAHAMWGFHHDKASDVLKLPEYFTTQAMIAFGHPASAESLPDPLREREAPSPRKALDELMFNGVMS